MVTFGIEYCVLFVYELSYQAITRIIVWKGFPHLRNNIPDYKHRLEILNLNSLSARRILKDVTLVYSIMRGASFLKMSNYYVLKPSNGRSSFFTFHIPHSK